jgi:hypothetical protein
VTVWLAEAYAGFFASFVAHVMNSWAVRGAPLCLQPRTRKTRVGERERESCGGLQRYSLTADTKPV